MKILEYMERERKSPDELWKKWKISKASFYYYLKGEKRPHFKTALRIEKETNGLVTIKDLRGNPYEKPYNS